MGHRYLEYERGVRPTRLCDHREIAHIETTRTREATSRARDRNGHVKLPLPDGRSRRNYNAIEDPLVPVMPPVTIEPPLPVMPPVTIEPPVPVTPPVTIEPPVPVMPPAIPSPSPPPVWLIPEEPPMTAVPPAWPLPALFPAPPVPNEADAPPFGVLVVPPLPATGFTLVLQASNKRPTMKTKTLYLGIRFTHSAPNAPTQDARWVVGVSPPLPRPWRRLVARHGPPAAADARVVR